MPAEDLCAVIAALEHNEVKTAVLSDDLIKLHTVCPLTRELIKIDHYLSLTDLESLLEGRHHEGIAVFVAIYLAASAGILQKRILWLL